MAVDELPSVLRADLGELSRLASAFTPTVETNLWAGVPGVSSALHFDAAHNVYAQLVGSKRFLLLAPELSDSLHVYPRLHPSTRQSQIDLNVSLRQPTSGRFPRFERIARLVRTGARPSPLVEAVLHPGDVLYLPPYWWHRASVAGNGSAISVAVYSRSHAMSFYDTLKVHPLPFEAGWGLSRRLASLRIYLLALSALWPPGSGRSLARDESFHCQVLRVCHCLLHADAYEWWDGAHVEADWPDGWMRTPSIEPGLDGLRNLLHVRYPDELDDETVVQGMGKMLHDARERLRQHFRKEPPVALTERDASRLRAHAHALREKVHALPRRGPPISVPIWQMEMGSLIEDVAGAAVGAREAEAAMRWAAGWLQVY